jgi:N-formylglutamate deformylase
VALLYQFAREMGASMLVPRWSRYVVDLNRPADAAPLYPGQLETGLVPTISFAAEPLYQDGLAPDAREVAARTDRYWRPYHHALLEELLRLRGRFDQVLVWDAHSIVSECPMFFAGRLPDLNVGTADGRSADPALAVALMTTLSSQTRFTHVLNGRFKGGFITRHYGRPALGMHAVQMELAQCNYMDEAAPFTYQPQRAEPLVQTLQGMLQTALSWLA